MKGGVWARCPDFCFTLTEQMELAGKTMGIIGYGSIGRQVAQIACAVGMRVVVYTSHPPKSETAMPDHGKGFSGNGDLAPISFVSLETLISSADIISLHCRMTEENKGLINRETIAHMKDGVIILNTARGPLIDEFDLAVALRTGKVRAAGIDVLAEEPPERNNLLISMDNCIVTPHNAWITRESRSRLIDIQYLNLEAFLNGDQLNRIV